MPNPQRSFPFPDQPWLLVTDVDDTLIGDAAALARLTCVLNDSPQVRLALNSSRPRASVQATLRQLDVPVPCAAMICAMGTQVCIEGRELPQWTERFEGWDRGVVDRLMADLGFEPHPPELQTPFKASFRVPQPQWTAARAAIAQTGLPAQVITSGSSDFDVLPPAAGKGSATLFLTEHLGVPIERLIVAGDSGNDAAMFRISPRGIVVGNARPELCGAVDRSRVYFARGARAAGLLEGLVHYRAVGGGAPRTTENDSLFSPSSA